MICMRMLAAAAMGWLLAAGPVFAKDTIVLHGSGGVRGSAPAESLLTRCG